MSAAGSLARRGVWLSEGAVEARFTGLPPAKRGLASAFRPRWRDSPPPLPFPPARFSGRLNADSASGRNFNRPPKRARRRTEIKGVFAPATSA